MDAVANTDKTTQEREASRLAPIQKLAVLLLMIDPENASKIMSQLEETDLEAVSTEMAKLSTVSQDLQGEILEEFSPLAVAAAAAVRGGVEMTKMLLEKSVGLFRASNIICRVASTRTRVAGMQQIVELEPQHLATLLRCEQLQTTALVVSYMTPDQASSFLALLRPENRNQILLRLATLAPTSIEVVEDVADTLQKKLVNNHVQALSKTGGAKVVAQILNMFPRNMSEQTLVTLGEQNRDLADAIKSKMFTFEDLIRVDLKSIQRLTQEIDMATLTVALKTASEKLKEHLLAGLSKRAADHVREELAYLGPLKLSQIEAAQTSIIATIKNLESEGEVDLAEIRRPNA